MFIKMQNLSWYKCVPLRGLVNAVNAYIIFCSTVRKDAEKQRSVSVSLCRRWRLLGWR